MSSSVIRHIYYRPESQELSVWFRESGRRYKYFDVPRELAEAFLAAPSRGKFFNDFVKGKFPSDMVSDPSGRRRYFG